GKNCAAFLTYDQPNGAEQVLAGLERESQVTGACIYKEGGGIWVRYPKSSTAQDFPPSPSASGHKFEHHSLFLFRSIHEPDGKQIGVIVLLCNLQQVYSRLRQYVGIVLEVLFVALVVALEI